MITMRKHRMMYLIGILFFCGIVVCAGLLRIDKNSRNIKNVYDLPVDGLQYQNIVFDTVENEQEEVESLNVARRILPAILNLANDDFLDDNQPFPSDVNEGNTRLTLVPVYRLIPNTSEKMINMYDCTVPTDKKYLLLLFCNDQLLGSTDWNSPAPHDISDDSYSPIWGTSTYDFSSRSIVRAIKLLQSEFSDKKFFVRVVLVQDGYWIIGSSGTKQYAAFLPLGPFDDIPSTQRLYSLKEVFSLSTIHEDIKLEKDED
jgi:hypothetical protein